MFNIINWLKKDRKRKINKYNHENNRNLPNINNETEKTSAPKILLYSSIEFFLKVSQFPIYFFLIIKFLNLVYNSS